jgi:hypothetical protein
VERFLSQSQLLEADSVEYFEGSPAKFYQPSVWQTILEFDGLILSNLPFAEFSCRH